VSAARHSLPSGDAEPTRDDGVEEVRPVPLGDDGCARRDRDLFRVGGKLLDRTSDTESNRSQPASSRLRGSSRRTALGCLAVHPPQRGYAQQAGTGNADRHEPHGGVEPDGSDHDRHGQRPDHDGQQAHAVERAEHTGQQMPGQGPLQRGDRQHVDEQVPAPRTT
jgi:hypothetical protein